MLDQATHMTAEIKLDQLSLGKMVWIKLAEGQPPRMAKPAAEGAEINGKFYKAFRPGDRFQ